jgi:hypothetical protein
MVLGKLETVLSSDYRGPRAGFTEAHVLKAILAIGASQNMGRGRLGSVLSLGQGEVRTLIRRLKDAGLLTVTKNGCTLTRTGQAEYFRISKIIPWSIPLDGKSLGLGKSCWVVNVRGKSDRIKKGIEQRDAAVKAGANGALSVVFTSGKFRTPPDDTDTEKSAEEPWATIRSHGVQDGDVIIIGGADDSNTAEFGSLSAALTIL